jgi:hypothetical protein
MFDMKLDVAETLTPFVKTTNGRGHTPEEVAEMCVDRLITVGDKSHPLLQAQARAFKEQMLVVVTSYIKMGIKQDRATLCGDLRKAGQIELADQLRRL